MHRVPNYKEKRGYMNNTERHTLDTTTCRSSDSYIERHLAYKEEAWRPF